MTVDEATQLYGADVVFTAASAGACEDYGPLRALGFDVSTIAEADEISTAVYRQMSAEEKAALHWEASQDMHKDREPVDWHDMDDVSISPRMQGESEAEYLQRVMLAELMQEQLEKRRKTCPEKPK